MRPPICAVCGRRFAPGEAGWRGGDAVTFRRAADHEPLPEGMAGHPDNVEWFCWPHIRPARRLRGLTRREALGKLRGWRAVLPI